MTSPSYTEYSTISFNPNKGQPEQADDEADVILHDFVDDLEVVIHPDPKAPSAAAAPAQPFVFPDPKPPTPPAVGLGDRNVDYNRVVLPMSGHANEEATREHFWSPKVGVEYTRGKARERYRVETGSVMKRNGVELDTETIKTPYLQGGGISMQVLEHATQQQIEDWAVGSLIWVCIAPKGQQSVVFYSHVCRGGQFHHSSLSAGGSVVGAGEWIVKNGKLRRISANSGHYQPTIDFLYRSVLHLADARHPDTSVFLYDSHTRAWVDRPWSDFIKAPSANGRYWTHPNAALASA